MLREVSVSFSPCCCVEADHRNIRPRSIHNPEVMEGYASQYMYLACIQFIKEVKSGAPFAEHSPMLNDISNVKSWAAVNEGMKKMYVGEVSRLIQSCRACWRLCPPMSLSSRVYTLPP